MAYDDVLVERVRDLTGGVPEKRMFGTLAFCVGEQIAMCVRGDGLLVRVGHDGEAEALRTVGVERALMGGREMPGWVTVPGELLDDPDLARWWQTGVRAALAAPPSAPRRRQRSRG